MNQEFQSQARNENIHPHKNLYHMFRAALVTIAKKKKQPRYLSVMNGQTECGVAIQLFSHKKK